MLFQLLMILFLVSCFFFFYFFLPLPNCKQSLSCPIHSNTLFWVRSLKKKKKKIGLRKLSHVIIGRHSKWSKTNKNKNKLFLSWKNALFYFKLHLKANIATCNAIETDAGCDDERRLRIYIFVSPEATYNLVSFVINNFFFISKFKDLGYSCFFFSWNKCIHLPKSIPVQNLPCPMHHN